MLGLRETYDPYRYLADKGLDSLLIASLDTTKVLNCLK